MGLFSIFAGEQAALCQGSLPQIELLEGPAGFLWAFRHLFTFRLASLPNAQKEIFGISSVSLLLSAPLDALWGTPSEQWQPRLSRGPWTWHTPPWLPGTEPRAPRVASVPGWTRTVESSPSETAKGTSTRTPMRVPGPSRSPACPSASGPHLSLKTGLGEFVTLSVMGKATYK